MSKNNSKGPIRSSKKKRMTADDRIPKKKKKNMMRSGDLRKNRLALLKKKGRKNKNKMDEGNFEIRISNQRSVRNDVFEKEVGGAQAHQVYFLT